jgi:hypothetical protein
MKIKYLIIINNIFKVINKLPRLENLNNYKQIAAATLASSNNNSNIFNNLQNDLKPVSFKLTTSNLTNTSNINNNNESNLELNRISKIVK